MRRIFLFLLCALVALAQAPDITTSGTFTGTGSSTPIFVSIPAGTTGISVWRLTYHVDGTSITAAQMSIDGANAANAAGCNSASFAAVSNSGSSFVEVSNPSASAAQGNVAVQTYYPCIRVSVTGATGSGGTVSYTLNGWKNHFIFSGSSGSSSTCGSQAAFNLSGSGNTRIVTGAASQSIHVCHISFATAAPEDVKLTSGTGTNCGTGGADVTGLYKSLTGLALDLGGGLITPSGTDLCINQSAAQALGGVVLYTIY